MQSDFPLVSPLVMPFAETSAASPLVRVRHEALSRFLDGEIAQLKSNESRQEYYVLGAALFQRNESNVAGILAGRASRSAMTAGAANAEGR